MKLIKINLYISLLLLIVILGGCKRSDLNTPVITNSTPPGVVSNIKVRNQNGMAVLTYSLPTDRDLSYVKAVYETFPGVQQQVIASRYTNTLTVVGFGDTLTHTIKLYAVNSSEVSSSPVSVTVNPLTPGYILARRSLKVSVAFGGFTISTKNPTADNLVIIPMVDTLGTGKKWVQTPGLDNIYSNDTLIVATRRGQPSVPRKYGFVVRDRWNHYSDTLYKTMTPYYEMELDNTKWSKLVLPHDAPILESDTDVPQMWRGSNITSLGWPNTYFTVEGLTTPQMVTIDLGSSHIFSRFIEYPKEEAAGFFAKNNLKDFEIWGSNSPDYTDPVGANNKPGASWTLLGTFHVIKPSGSPYGTETQADYNAGYGGIGFDFGLGNGAFRYIRIRQLNNWLNNCSISIRQFKIYGQ